MTALAHAVSTVTGRILAAHRTPDGTLDAPGLLAEAIRVRRATQDLEAIVNPGGVSDQTRARLAILQGADIAHRRVLDTHVPGWVEALDAARRQYPRSNRAKVMTKAGRALGLL